MPTCIHVFYSTNLTIIFHEEFGFIGFFPQFHSNFLRHENVKVSTRTRMYVH